MDDIFQWKKWDILKIWRLGVAIGGVWSVSTGISFGILGFAFLVAIPSVLIFWWIKEGRGIDEVTHALSAERNGRLE